MRIRGPWGPAGDFTQVATGGEGQAVLLKVSTARGGVSRNGAEHMVLGEVFPILTGLQMGTRGPGRLEMPARTGLDRRGEASRSRAPRGWEKALR